MGPQFSLNDIFSSQRTGWRGVAPELSKMALKTGDGRAIWASFGRELKESTPSRVVSKLVKRAEEASSLALFRDGAWVARRFCAALWGVNPGFIESIFFSSLFMVA